MAFVTTTSPDLYATTSNLEEIPAGADPLQYMDDDKANQILVALTALHGWASGVPVSETANGHFLALAAGSSAAVSIAGGVRIRNNAGALDYSYNTGAYARLLSKLTLASQATGDIMYASAADTWTRLAAGTNGHVLTLSGGLPVWAAGGGGGLSSPVGAADGGTGITSYAIGDMLYASGATTISKLAAVGTGQVLASAGVTTAPAYTANPTLTTLGLAAGSTAACSLYATGDANTGVYFPAADQIALVSGGSARVVIDGSTELHSLIQTGPAGSASLPTYGFTGDPNTGAYNIGADQYGITAGGTLRLTVSTAALTSTLPALGPDGAAATPTWAFSGETNTGLYRVSSGTVAIATSGVKAHEFSATGTMHAATTATTNAVVSMFEKRLNSSGTAAVGFGMADRRYLENASGTDIECATESVTYTNATAASETVDWTISLRSAGSLAATATLTGAGAWKVGAGSASLPSLSFLGDPNTGLYSSAADEMSFTFGGTARIRSDGSRTVWTYGGASADTPGFMAEWKTDAAEGRIKVRSSNTGGYGGFYAIGSDANKVLSMSMYSASAAGTACGVSYASLAEIVSVAANMVIYTTGAQRIVFGTNNTNTFELGSTASTIGFFGVTPSARAAAYTQTYSTAARTVTSGMTVDQLAQIVNSLIDDLQAYGLVQ